MAKPTGESDGSSGAYHRRGRDRAYCRCLREARQTRRTGALAGALGDWCVIAVISLGSGDLTGLPLQGSHWLFVLAVTAAGALVGWIVVEMAFSSMREVDATRAVMRDSAVVIGRSARSTVDAVRERGAERALKQPAGASAEPWPSGRPMSESRARSRHLGEGL